MKLLLDENLPIVLRHEIVGHDCETVRYNGWSAKQNGELLTLAADAGFEALLTKDSNLAYQQDQRSLPLAIVAIHAQSNKIDDIRPLIPALLAALESLTPNAVTVVGEEHG